MYPELFRDTILSNFFTKFAQIKYGIWLNFPCMFANSVLSISAVDLSTAQGLEVPTRGSEESKIPI